MTEATTTISPVLVSRKLNGQLVINLHSSVTSEEVITAYYEFCVGMGEPEGPAEITWNATENTLDIGTAELIIPEGFYPGFDIVAEEMLSGEALDSALMEEEKLEPETKPTQPEVVEIAIAPAIVEIPTPGMAVATGHAFNVTPIHNNNNVTKIQGNNGVTKIAAAAPSPLASPQIIDRLVKEGVGARAKQGRQQPQQVRQQRPAAPVVHHSERGRELLANALNGFRQHGTDGVDFINTSFIADTKLGKMLDINAHVPFQIVDAGEFASVGAFWYFIASETPDESVRHIYGKACRDARYRLSGTASRKVEGFNRLIAEATWAKVCSNEELRTYMTGNALRYRCFFMQEGSDFPVSTPLENWYMPILEEIGYVLKQIRKTGDETMVPDFSFLERRYDNNQRGNQNGNQRNRY